MLFALLDARYIFDIRCTLALCSVLTHHHSLTVPFCTDCKPTLVCSTFPHDLFVWVVHPHPPALSLSSPPTLTHALTVTLLTSNEYWTMLPWFRSFVHVQWYTCMIKRQPTKGKRLDSNSAFNPVHSSQFFSFLLFFLLYFLLWHSSLCHKKKNSFTFIHLSRFHFHSHSHSTIYILTLSSAIRSHSHSHSHSRSSSFAIPPRSPSYPPSRNVLIYTHILSLPLTLLSQSLSTDPLVLESALFSFILLCVGDMSSQH